MPRWKEVLGGVWRCRDSCAVYAVRGPSGLLVFNAGTGTGAEALAEAGPGPATVLLTHHFRDHADGARAFAAAGATVLAPVWEREYLADPLQHFQERQTWNSYDNRWDRHAPVRPVPVSRWLHDWDRTEIAGLTVEVVPTPGVTQGAVSYVVTAGGRRLAFVGEVLAAPGRLSRLAPLQYDYNDLNGAVNVWHACRRLGRLGLDVLLPSYGEPMTAPTSALTATREALKTIDGIHPGFAARLADPDADDVEEILPRLWRSKYASAETYFVRGRTGKVLALDYGYATMEYVAPQRHHLSNRRPFLHGLEGIKKRTGRRGVDAVVVTHYHDDHVNGIAQLQRLFDAEVLAPLHVGEMLESPSRFDRPCLWHEPVRVSGHLVPEKPLVWDGLTIRAHPMSGHTRFSALLCLEIDGVKVAHTGDQIFFEGAWDVGWKPGARLFTNHVYRNGLDPGCYRQSLELLRAFKPDLVLTGHTRPYKPGKGWEDAIAAGAAAFDAVHRGLGGCTDDGVHFGYEGRGGELQPYRVRVDEGGAAVFEGWVMNPFPEPATARAALVVPEGWTGDAVEVALPPRGIAPVRLGCTVPAGLRCRRQPVALELTVNGLPFGQVAEALVTVGHPLF